VMSRKRYDRKEKPLTDVVLFGYDRTNKRYVAVEVDSDGKVTCDAS